MMMEIYCCGCGGKVPARLTNGAETYPHRPDLFCLPFWKCDACGNKVGCHHKSADPTKPLGIIPTPELGKARTHIHRVLDPLWKKAPDRAAARRRIYREISDKLGYEYHTSKIKDLETAREIFVLVRDIAQRGGAQCR